MNYILHHIQEIADITDKIAKNLPLKEEVIIGIHELLMNAIEHGNLEIGYELKSELLRSGKWLDEINDRLEMPKYKNRKVHIEIKKAEDNYEIIIKDDGNGFNWQEYINKNQDNTALHGRGILMAFNSGFGKIIFNEIGNEVTCVLSPDVFFEVPDFSHLFPPP